LVPKEHHQANLGELCSFPEPVLHIFLTAFCNRPAAPQVMHKAPLVEAKQIEHVANERAILGEVSHPFLVGLVGAYQDTASLYLLQVGVGLSGWYCGCGLSGW
jgi:hypothetical protein